MHEEIDKNPISFSLPRIPGYEMEITDDQTKLTGDTLAVDFETYYEGNYSLKCMDPHSYCRDPRFDAYIMSVYDGKYCWVGHPRILTGRKRPRTKPSSRSTPASTMPFTSSGFTPRS